MLAYCRVAPDEHHLVKWKRSLAFAGRFSEGIFQLAHCVVAPAQLAYCRVAPDVTRAWFGGLILAVLSALQCKGTEGSFYLLAYCGVAPHHGRRYFPGGRQYSSRKHCHYEGDVVFRCWL